MLYQVLFALLCAPVLGVIVLLVRQSQEKLAEAEALRELVETLRELVEAEASRKLAEDEADAIIVKMMRECHRREAPFPDGKGMVPKKSSPVKSAGKV